MDDNPVRAVHNTDGQYTTDQSHGRYMLHITERYTERYTTLCCSSKLLDPLCRGHSTLLMLKQRSDQHTLPCG